MELYQFADVSHHKGALNIQAFADLGHRIVVSKASDNYHLPDINGKYDFAADRHYDARFVENFVNTRESGLVAGAYHFCRFDRPLPLGNRAAIVQANLDYFQIAIKRLPEQYQDEVDTAIMDMEQSADQLRAAGLNRAVISAMAKDMVTLFLENYSHVILYSGSWWTDEWLTSEATEWMAERVGVWEPEYVTLISNYPWNKNYKPSVPKGFSNEYAESVDDYIGKLFAWQYTAKGRIPGEFSNIDLNLTALKKEELFKLFHQEGAVDPPPEPPGNGNGDETDVLKAIQALDARLVQIQETLDDSRAAEAEILALSQAIKQKIDQL
ncbi:MAG TPA: GH25 family lysozyme [Anaerolineales bacterium]|nr:GH25 family lysozyme [Anaerolineales bacterium]